MTRRDFIVLAGLHLQPEVMSQLATKLSSRNEKLIPLRGLQCPVGYTDRYVARLYERVANELRKLAQGNRETLLDQATLTLLYVDRPEIEIGNLLERFGVEALLSPLGELASAPVRTRNEIGAFVNVLTSRIRKAMRRMRSLRSAILEEVTNRDNRTCLLLPPKTFGSGFRAVQEGVYFAARCGDNADVFRKRLEFVTNSLAAKKIRKNRYFVGSSGLVFESPAKAGARHELTPTWEDKQHESSCVIRGRLRFGVSYDPHFHYDCDVSNRMAMTLPGCHEPQSVSGRMSHVNVAPNDNVRKKR